MKSPRFLAALAMAAVLTTGVTTTAHAAVTPGTFTPVGGSTATGQLPMQEAEVIETPAGAKPHADLHTSGDIEINGTFTKTVTTFPTPTEEGRYLRVSMPIKMDFTYNIDNDTMQSAKGTILNKSVYATRNSGNITTEYQNIKMTIQDYEDNAKGISTMDLTKIEFVDNTTTNPNANKLQLPLQLKVDSQTGTIKTYSLKSLQKPAVKPEIKINGNSSLTVEIDKIAGKSAGNTDILTDASTKTSHNLKLKFEYDGR